MLVIIRRNQKLKEQAKFQKDQTKIQKILREKKEEDKESETFNGIFNIYSSIRSNRLCNGCTYIRKGEEQEDEVCSYSCICTLYICV